MRQIVITLFLISNCLSFVLLSSQFPFSYTFTQWKDKSLSVPRNPNKFEPSLVSRKEFFSDTVYKAIRLFSEVYSNAIWFRKTSNACPFAQKLMVPAESIVYFFGDLHGNIHDLMRILSVLKDQNCLNDNFEIVKPNSYLIFLGDYVDRGFYGVEVLYTILRLKLSNPDHVFMVRGNHEDIDLNAHYGFLEELETKFGTDNKQFTADLISHIYNQLPSVLYIGCKNNGHTNVIQCCHGGIEIGYNPSELLSLKDDSAFEYITVYRRSDIIRSLPFYLKSMILTLPDKELENCVPLSPTKPVHNGFLWNDFIADDELTIIDYLEGRGWVFGKLLTEELLKKFSNSHYTIHAIFRAHQHYGSMLTKLKEHNGIASLWNNRVITFLSGQPQGIDFVNPNCGIFSLTADPSAWQLRPLL